jgi:hypothetical protein
VVPGGFTSIRRRARVSRLENLAQISQPTQGQEVLLLLELEMLAGSEPASGKLNEVR